MAVYSTAGSYIQINNGSLANVSHPESISGPSGSKQEIDTTALDDTATTSVAGAPDYGEVQVSCFADGADAGQLAVKFVYDAGTTKGWKIVTPGGTNNSYTFNGYVKSWSLNLGKNAPGKIDFTVKVTGGVTVS